MILRQHAGAAGGMLEGAKKSQRSACQSDEFVMTGSNLINEKIAETLEFPRFFGRADRI
ncbi:hypothetical protein ACR5KS_10165 [Leucobacter sp. W1153]|uniref:hypothetical protein n=1 Tax=Leucobacter sp. W1153 TaxID=3439064 RepID=UPI003F2DC5D7